MAADRPGRHNLPVADRAPDVIVIGAGIIGCAAAYELSRRGARVRVLDAREIAGGATQASAGVLGPHIEGHDRGPLLALGVRSLGLYDDFIARLRADHGAGIEYERSGTLEVSLTDEGAARLAAQRAAHREHGVASRLLDAPEVRALEPALADDVNAGLLIDGHGFVAAADLTTALAAAAVMRGAAFTASTRARRIDAEPGGVRVETDSGSISAGRVVLAAGSWSGQLGVGPAAAIPVRPVRGQLLELSWHRRALGRIVWGAACYLVPRRAAMLVGATSEEVGFDERATVAGVRDLLDAACDLVPSTWQAGFASVKVGLRPATPDNLPAIGPSARVEGLVYATGHYRNGILLAPLTARLVADLILDGREDPDLAITRPQRFGDF